MSKINWNEENTQVLVDAAAGVEVVSVETVEGLAEQLETSTRSVSSKLRSLGYKVQSVSEAKTSPWTDELTAELVEFVEANAGNLTYADVAAAFNGGSFDAKQIQGKVLSLELTGSIKKSEPKVADTKYTEAETEKFVGMVEAGSSVEAIAEAFGRSVQSIRGKALSLLRKELIAKMPIQETKTAKDVTDVLANVDVANSTVAQIAEQTGKSERGVKSMLTHRGLDCEDYKGAARRAKLDAAAE